MPGPMSRRDLLAEVMAGAQKVQTPLLAEQLRTDRVQAVDTSEERRRFWQAAISEQQEQQMWRDEMAARGLTTVLPGSPEAIDIGMRISKAKYPDRFDMMGQEGRNTVAQQAQWAFRHMQKGPPSTEGG